MNIAPTPAFSAALYAACARYGGWHCEPRNGVIRRTEPDAPSPIELIALFREEFPQDYERTVAGLPEAWPGDPSDPEPLGFCAPTPQSLIPAMRGE